MSIIHKRSSVAGKVPTTAQLALGELAVNTTDGKLFMKKSVNGVESVVDLARSVEGTEKIGDMVITHNTMPAPKYLPADGSYYVQSAYPELFQRIGYQNTDLIAVAGPTAAVTDTAGNLRGADGIFFIEGVFYMTFARVYSSGTINKLYTSTDGLTWTLKSSNARGKTLAFGNGMFVMCRAEEPYPYGYGNSRAWYSTDAVTWTAISVNSLFGSKTQGEDEILDIIFANGKFVMVGESGTFPGYNVAISTDGISWTRYATPALKEITWTGTHFVGYNYYMIYTSPDGITWTVRDTGQTTQLTHICSNGNGTVVAFDYSERVLRSTDHGVTWTHTSTLSIQTTSLRKMIHFNDGAPTFAVGVFGTSLIPTVLFSTDDGATFYTKLNNQFDSADYMAFGNGVLIVTFMDDDVGAQTYRLYRPYNMATQFSTPKRSANTVGGSPDAKIYLRAQ